MNKKGNPYQFYIDNEVKIGEDFESSHPHYYSSLRNAFYGYFDTYLHLKDSLLSLVDFKWERKNIGFTFSIPYDTIVTIILEFHRFFELLIKDLLSQVNPYLSRRISSKPVDYILGDVSPKHLKTVEFSEAMKRFKAVCKKNENDPEYEYLKKYAFLSNNDSGLNELTWWRNRLTHNGKAVPNIISLDYLISQKIIPLVFEVIKTDFLLTDKDKTPHYFITASGINIVERITQIKFDKKDVELSEKEEFVASSEITGKFIELYQLKGVGRAAMNYNKFLGISFNHYNEYHRLKHKDNHRFVRFQEQDPNYLKTNKCLCCDNLTLVTFKEKYYHEIEGREIDLIWSRCLVCDYGVSNKLGNPKRSGITEQDIFDEGV